MARLPLTALLLLSLGASVLAQDVEPDCHSTTEAVLKRPLAATKQIALAETQYLEALKAEVAANEAKLATLRATRADFERTRETERAGFDKRIAGAGEAIQEIVARVNKEIAELTASLAELREQKPLRQSTIDGVQERIRKLRESLGQKTASGHKKGMWSASMEGWETYRAEETSRRDARMALFAKGEVRIHLKPLGYSASWNTVLAEIEKTQTYLGEQLMGRLRRYHLKALGWSADWKTLQAERQKREQHLALVRSQIAAGTYRLHVKTLGYTTDRNGVQKLIAAAERGYRDTIAAWPAKTYATHNPRVSYTVSNGKLEELRGDEQDAIAEFQAAGDKATVHVPALGYTTDGFVIKENLRAAQAANTPRTIAHWSKALASYAQAKTAWVAKKRERVAFYDAALAEHKDLQRKDLAKRRDHLDTYLKRALAQTPCGAGSLGTADPRREAVQRHRTAALGSGDADGQQRLEAYDDWVYLEADGTVHGDPDEGLRQSIGEPEVAAPEDPLQVGAAAILALKDAVDWLNANAAAGGAAIDLASATQQLDAFIQAMSALDPADPDFFKLRKKIRQTHLKTLQDLLSRGVLSQSRLQGVLDALRKTGSGTKTTRATIQRLESLLNATNAARQWTLPRFDRVLAAATDLKDAAKLTKVRSAARTTLASIAKTVEGGLHSMTRLDQGLLGLSVVAAASEAYDRVSKGQDPYEATGRAAINLAIELAIAGFPITAAAEIVSQLVFVTAGALTGDEAYSQATVEKVTKYIVEKVLVDTYADGWQWLGEKSVVIGRLWNGEQTVDAMLASVDKAKVRRSLQTVEGLLDALPPGDPAEARLMNSRRALRQIFRAGGPG